jgi:hypothetical protein
VPNRNKPSGAASPRKIKGVTNTMKTLNLSLDTIRKSSRIADEFMNQNDHLRNVSTYSEYNQRAAGFAEILDGETGFTSFTPIVKFNCEEAFQAIMRNGEQHDFFQKLDDMDYYVRAAFQDLFWMVFYSSHADIVSRRVPSNAMDFIKLKKSEFPEQWKQVPSSPKLTRLVAWMFGEKAGGVMDYLTTKAPREDKAGAVEEYRVFISVLPHNVAGMSFYSSKNHGGDSWQGYNGTSCQDPRRSHDASLINHLPASIKEQTAAVAWLAKRENNDIWQPVYEARAMVRIVPAEQKTLFMICNPYFSSPTTKNILIEGLKNQLAGKAIFAPEITRWGVECTDIEVEISDCEYSGETRQECSTCNGHGVEYIEHYCNCEHCDRGDEEIECSECEGTGFYEDSDGVYLPYIDDTNVIDIEDTRIIYTLPTSLLLELGAMVEQIELEDMEDIEV